MNDLSYNSILSFIEFNPSFEYKFFDDKESREFVKNNFNELFLYYYDILYPGAFKADFSDIVIFISMVDFILITKVYYYRSRRYIK